LKYRNGLSLAALAISAVMPATAFAQAVTSADLAALMQRLDKLEADNAELKRQIAEAQRAATKPVEAAQAAAPRDEVRAPEAVSGVGINSAYAFAVLDHAEGVNRRQILQLESRQNGSLDNIVTLSGAVTAIADAHWSNRSDKFGYLMRHPTLNNQRTKATQEIALHSAQLAVTVAPTSDITGYAEMLYDPEQSFGAGTVTAVTRNQIQLRKAWVMWGNLNKSPLYAAIGKMDVPFGLEDTVSPFTNSSNWHAFAPLAYGGLVGYYDGNLSVRAMAVGGGAQFRSANTPVDGTNIPSKLNNYALDVNYRANVADDLSAMVGGSYIHGSAYCQNYPVTHFSPCTYNNPAWALYGKIDAGRLHLIADFARTTKAFTGSAVPSTASAALSVYQAAKVSSLTIGGRYSVPISENETNISLEFSRFQAGAKGSPWERQKQWVLGLSHRLATSVDVFGELVRTEGYVPLNFLSGGNFPSGATWSEHDAHSNVVVLGTQLAF